MQTMRTTNSRLMKTVGGEMSIRSRSIEVSGSSGAWISSVFHPSLDNRCDLPAIASANNILSLCI